MFDLISVYWVLVKLLLGRGLYLPLKEAEQIPQSAMPHQTFEIRSTSMGNRNSFKKNLEKILGVSPRTFVFLNSISYFVINKIQFNFKYGSSLFKNIIFKKCDFNYIQLLISSEKFMFNQTEIFSMHQWIWYENCTLEKVILKHSLCIKIVTLRKDNIILLVKIK